ncbi:MAG TPA: FAD-dependent oxidoreductase [Terriglobales bacterium]|nr:FAD-dependent oxidoreductase [Terriglobales bacterium]
MAGLGRTRILILGGGFGGVYTAIRLEQLLKREPAVEISLVNKDNYLVFQPMLPEVISGSIGILDVISPIRRLCPRTNLYTRTVESIDLKSKTVTMSSGFRPRPHVLEYDHLVIAMGNMTSFMGQPGLADHALPFKYLGDALVLRNHIIHALEEADIERDPDVRKALLTFVVAGGGFSGVEAIAELNDFVREGAKSFRNINVSEIKVILLHAGDLILPELPKSLATFAQNQLQKRGVDIRLNTRLAGATAESALLSGGERIATKTLVSTVPSAPHPILASLPVKLERGRIVVNEQLQVPDWPGVWAVGDCAAVPDVEAGGFCPPTAQHALRQGTRLADNIVATLRGEPLKAFRFKALGKLAGLGHRSAVAEVLGVKLSGIFAWFVWRAIYLSKMPGLDRQIRVATDWFLDLLLPADIVQLRTDRAAGISRQHYEADETIFREGDKGDRLYIVVNGAVQIVSERPNQPRTLIAELGPGDCFGEMALISDNPRNATARTAGAVDVLTVDREAFHALFSHLPPLRNLFQGLIAQRMKGPANGGEKT